LCIHHILFTGPVNDFLSSFISGILRITDDAASGRFSSREYSIAPSELPAMKCSPLMTRAISLFLGQSPAVPFLLRNNILHMAVSLKYCFIVNDTLQCAFALVRATYISR